jgi:hypothetical protein
VLDRERLRIDRLLVLIGGFQAVQDEFRLVPAVAPAVQRKCQELSGAATALGIDGLTAGEVAFLDQVDGDGKPIGVMPAILLVPTALSAIGSQLFKSMELRDNTSTAKYPVTNPHQGKFRVEVSRYLGNAKYPGFSAKAW